MNKKFLSAILFGALMVSSTGTFVSCKDYDDDIDQINSELADLKSQIAALQTEVSNGNWVTEVVDVEGGFKVTFNNGKTYTIVNGKDGKPGEAGKPGEPGKDGKGTTVEVKDGYWYLNGEKTEYIAVKKGDMNKVHVPYVNEAGFWVFFDKDGKEVVSEFKAMGATYVVEANGVFTLYAPDANGKMVAVKLPSAGGTLTDVELLGATVLAKKDANLSQSSNIKEDLTVNYAFVEKIIKTYDGNKETTWSAQKTVTKGQVLTTLAPEDIHLMARINAGADAADMEFSLENSKGETLPISVKAPEAYKGLLSKSSNGLYALALDNVSTVFEKGKYDKLFTTGVYALAEKSGFVSNYSLNVKAEAATVTEAKVLTVDNKNITNSNFYEVELNKDNAITFDYTNSKFVYDYYVEAVDPTIAKMFGFAPNKANGTFKVTKLADNVTTASFDVYVYKLHIDGKIYREIITIKPIRTLGKEVVYDLGKLQIKREMKMNISLDKMFAALGEDADIWKNEKLGVNSWELTCIQDKSEETLQMTAFLKNAKGENLTTGFTKATQVAMSVNAVASGKGTLVPGESYTATINYYHDNNVLNSIQVKFTPVMPTLESFIAKRTALWNANTLMAYFVDPKADNNSVLASDYDMTKGFTKLGSANEADKTVITFALDKDQKINNINVLNNTKNLAIITNNKIALETAYDFNADGQVNEADVFAYGQELNVKVTATYLDGAYKFTDAEIAAAAFKINVQSALKAGKVVPAAGASITLPAAAAGEVAKLTADMITGYTYNDQPYSLFETLASENATADFKYSYIQKVSFESVDKEIYEVKEVVKPTWGDKKEIPSYVAIVSKNISQTTTTKIKVTVTDWFGYTKVAEIPLTITVGK